MAAESGCAGLSLSTCAAGCQFVSQRQELPASAYHAGVARHIGEAFVRDVERRCLLRSGARSGAEEHRAAGKQDSHRGCMRRRCVPWGRLHELLPLFLSPKPASAGSRSHRTTLPCMQRTCRTSLNTASCSAAACPLCDTAAAAAAAVAGRWVLASARAAALCALLWLDSGLSCACWTPESSSKSRSRSGSCRPSRQSLGRDGSSACMFGALRLSARKERHVQSQI